MNKSLIELIRIVPILSLINKNRILFLKKHCTSNARFKKHVVGVQCAVIVLRELLTSTRLRSE